MKEFKEFQLYLETGEGFRFLEENENGDTFLLDVDDTDCILTLNWDNIEKDIKNMGLDLLPMSILEVLEGVSLLLPERKFVWNENGAVFIVHPILISMGSKS